MTIYDAAPTPMALVLSIFGFTICKVGHDRAISARDARRACETAAA